MSEIGHTYGVELFFDAPPALDDPRLSEALVRACPTAKVLAKGGNDKAPFMAVHEDMVPAQTLILGGKGGVDVGAYAHVLQQTRDWPEAEAALGRAKHQCLVTDLMASGLPHRERLDLFQRALGAIASVLRPIALHWQPAGKMVDPQRFLAATDRTELDFLALNVRMFNVANQGRGDIVMDSLGLGALGLADVQMHYRDLEPDDVARFLFNIAAYLLDKGDIIEDGHTVGGLRPDQKWRCQHEDALVPPARVVLDIDPGAPWAAGDRKR